MTNALSTAPLALKAAKQAISRVPELGLESGMFPQTSFHHI